MPCRACFLLTPHTPSLPCVGGAPPDSPPPTTPFPALTPQAAPPTPSLRAGPWCTPTCPQSCSHRSVPTHSPSGQSSCRTMRSSSSASPTTRGVRRGCHLMAGRGRCAGIRGWLCTERRMAACVCARAHVVRVCVCVCRVRLTVCVTVCVCVHGRSCVGLMPLWHGVWLCFVREGGVLYCPLVRNTSIPLPHSLHARCPQIAYLMVV